MIYYNGTDIANNYSINYNGTSLSAVFNSSTLVWPNSVDFSFHYCKTGTCCVDYSDDCYNIIFWLDNYICFSNSGLSRGIVSNPFDRAMRQLYNDGILVPLYTCMHFPQSGDNNIYITACSIPDSVSNISFGRCLTSFCVPAGSIKFCYGKDELNTDGDWEWCCKGSYTLCWSAFSTGAIFDRWTAILQAGVPTLTWVCSNRKAVFLPFNNGTITGHMPSDAEQCSTCIDGYCSVCVMNNGQGYGFVYNNASGVEKYANWYSGEFPQYYSVDDTVTLTQ